jgi:hypothetical protein
MGSITSMMVFIPSMRWVGLGAAHPGRLLVCTTRVPSPATETALLLLPVPPITTPRNMRLFSLVTLFTTTFAALYMSSVSLKHGLSAEAARLPPRGLDDIFSGLA